MLSSDCSTVTPREFSCVITVGEAYEITYSATEVGMKRIYFRGLIPGKGTYSIPLEPSPLYGDNWKVRTHPSPEHPDTSETSPSDRHAKTLGAMKWKITTTEPSNITFEAAPAPCLDLKRVYCEFSSMPAVTIVVELKPIRHGDYACGHFLLPDRYRRSPDPFTTLEDHISWTLPTSGPEKGRWAASRALCIRTSSLDVEIDVSGAGTYTFGVENVRPHTSAAEDSMSDRIPESPSNKLGSTACKAPAGSRRSNSGACDSPSNGSSPAGGEIVPMESPVPVPGGLSGNLAQLDIGPLSFGKRSNGGREENVPHKRVRGMAGWSMTECRDRE
jgi:hypothetical protein